MSRFRLVQDGKAVWQIDAGDFDTAVREMLHALLLYWDEAPKTNVEQWIGRRWKKIGSVRAGSDSAEISTVKDCGGEGSQRRAV